MHGEAATECRIKCDCGPSSSALSVGARDDPWSQSATDPWIRPAAQTPSISVSDDQLNQEETKKLVKEILEPKTLESAFASRRAQVHTVCDAKISIQNLVDLFEYFFVQNRVALNNNNSGRPLNQQPRATFQL